MRRGAATVLLVGLLLGLLIVLILGKTPLKCRRKGAPVVVQGGGVVHLRRTTSVGSLCLLARVSKTMAVDDVDEEEYAGVGRSYDGHEWEAVAGPYVETVQFRCKSGVSKKGHTRPCRVRLPQAPRGYEFVLLPLRQRRKSLSTQDETARFLQQATFGPRRQDLWRTTNEEVWIESQMRETPTTSHRAYWRRRATPRMVEVQGEVPDKPAMFLQTHPCQMHSRWRRHAFSPLDLRRWVEISASEPGGPQNRPQYTLAIDGQIRTVVTELSFKNSAYELQVPGRYEICFHAVGDEVGGRFFLRHPSDGACLEVTSPGNPPVRIVFWIYRPQLLLTLPVDQLNPIPGSQESEYLLLSDHDEPLCPKIPTVMQHVVVFARMGSSNTFLLYDPHVRMAGNTPANPLPDGGGFASLSSGGLLHCSNAPRTFVNEGLCRLSFESSACGRRATKEHVSMKLAHGTLRTFFRVTGRLVYAIQDLRLPDGTPSPCSRGVRSRWIPAFGRSCTENGLAESTQQVLTQLLQAAPASARMRDITFPNDDSVDSCAEQDAQKTGMKINVDEGDCWQHVHPDYWNVYDFTAWAAEMDAHPGNPVRAAVGLPNPIAEPAQLGQSRLSFPESHLMQDWSSNVDKMTYVGRFGEEVPFVDLPESLRVEAVADAVGALGGNRTGDGVVVCGSPGEVANSPWVMNGNRNSYDVTLNEANNLGTRQRVSVWTQVALEASDQLRQRVAWALSQVFCISPHDFVIRDNSESFLNYYDIMVRHAFGNLQDLLREVSYSPMMAEMLTYIRSKSTGYIYFEEDRIAAPDENFAREIMQLFTMGPTLLNLDGTPVRDATTGEPIRAYDNDDVQSFARAWTGFDKQDRRSNLEDYFGVPKLNWVDPLRIVPRWRDPFPKKDLYDGFIGDRYPRCRDLPPRAFLRQGARYRLLGSTSQPDLQLDPHEWEGNPDIKRVVLEGAKSTLYRALCRQRDGECTYPTELVLQRNLPCHGIECRIDTVRVVQVAPNIFYEYVQVPCVQMAFFDNPALIKSASIGTALCADAKIAAAGTACCRRGFRNVAHQNATCEYAGERVTYVEAQRRCDAPQRNAEMCPFRHISTETCGDCCPSQTHFWSQQPCQLFVKVAPDGKVAIVHIPGGPPNINTKTINYFSIQWHDDNYPSVNGNRCGRGACEEVEGGACLCGVTVEELPVFTSTSQIKNGKQLLRRLHIGSFPPDMYDDGYLRKRTGVADLGIFAYSPASDGNAADMNVESVLEVQDDLGRTLFLKNVESTVIIAGSDGTPSFSFRNPPHFATLVDLNLRDIHYEIDAVLEHYTLHQNVAPFISFRLIQRLAGISNPSPSYVKRVAIAFRQGVYQGDGGGTFGTGKYGDLAATVAAVLLDREARSVVLDADPSHGSLREPVLKVIGFMRAMEYEPASPRVDLFDLDVKIGQQPHAIPSVFSFFRPEYVPDGPATTALLTSPEALVHTTPTVIGVLNGLFSLIKFGLLGCFHGFGTGLCCECRAFEEGNYESSFGNLSFLPNSDTPKDVVDELATLLTAGRLSKMNRKIIADQYAKAPNPGAALRTAQQLMVSTPEFHATGLVETDGSARPKVEELPATPGRDYKAIVYLLQEGGSDSYNMLVPHSECGAKDLYQEYRQVRSSVAVPKEALHVIDASRTPQPCRKFGVHPQLPTLAELYNSGELLFLANVGILSEKVNKQNYLQLTKAELFAHNFMQTEVKKLDLHDEKFGTGILGRFVDILQSQGWRTSAIAVEEPSLAVVGTPKISPPAKVIRRGGQVDEFDPRPSSDRIRPTIRLLNGASSSTSSVYGETWSRKLDSALDENESLFDAVSGIELKHTFEETEVGGGFEAVAKFIVAHHERGVDRDVFYIRQTGYDQHLWYDKLGERFREMSRALKSFAAEMKERNLWNNVVVVDVSEFGRTMSPNSGSGTDHGWGGNYFLAGGEVDGKKILGQFPNDLTESGPFDAGRGRFIPTTPWDAVWNGVGDWFGISNLNRAIPNRLKFQEDLFWEKDLFRPNASQGPSSTQNKPNDA